MSPEIRIIEESKIKGLDKGVFILNREEENKWLTSHPRKKIKNHSNPIIYSFFAQISVV